MACKCIKGLTERLESNILGIVKMNPGFKEITSSNFSNGVLCIAGGSNVPISIPFESEYTMVSNAGNVKSCKEVVHMMPTFCPFCGKKYNK